MTKRVLLSSILALSAAMNMYAGGRAVNQKNPNRVRAAIEVWAKRNAEDRRLKADFAAQSEELQIALTERDQLESQAKAAVAAQNRMARENQVALAAKDTLVSKAQQATEKVVAENSQLTQKLAVAQQATQVALAERDQLARKNSRLVVEAMNRAIRDGENQAVLKSGLAVPAGEPVTLVNGKDMKLAFKEAQKAAQATQVSPSNALVAVAADTTEQTKQKLANISSKTFDALRNRGLSPSETTIIKQPLASDGALVTAKQARAWRNQALHLYSLESAAKREARAAVKFGAGLGVPTVNAEPSISFLKSFVEKLPTLEKLAAQEMADNFKNGQRATEQLLKYYEPAKKAGLIATYKLSTECAKLFGGLAVYGTVLGAGMKAIVDRQAAQEAQRIAEERAAALANRTLVQKAHDQLRELKDKAVSNPKVAVAIAAGTAVATTGLTVGGAKAVKALRAKTEEEPVEIIPTIEELYEKHHNNLKEFAHALNLYHYTKDDFENANLELPRGGKVYILSQIR